MNDMFLKFYKVSQMCDDLSRIVNRTKDQISQPSNHISYDLDTPSDARKYKEECKILPIACR